MENAASPPPARPRSCSPMQLCGDSHHQQHHHHQHAEASEQPSLLVRLPSELLRAMSVPFLTRADRGRLALASRHCFEGGCVCVCDHGGAQYSPYSSRTTDSYSNPTHAPHHKHTAACRARPRLAVRLPPALAPHRSGPKKAARDAAAAKEVVKVRMWLLLCHVCVCPVHVRCCLCVCACLCVCIHGLGLDTHFNPPLPPHLHHPPPTHPNTAPPPPARARAEPGTPGAPQRGLDATRAAGSVARG